MGGSCKIGGHLGHDERLATKEIARLQEKSDKNLVVSDEYLARNRAQWKFSLIEKFLGHRVLSTEFLARTIYQRWKTKGSYDIIPIGNGFLIFKFNYENDKMMVKTKWP